MQRLRARVLWLPFCLSLAVSSVYADVIYMKSGETVKGLVVEEHHDRILLSTEQGEKPIFRRDIDEVFYDDPERNYLYMGNQAIESGDFGLAGEFFRKATQIDPQFSEADEALHRLKDLQQQGATRSVPRDWMPALRKGWGLELTVEADRPRVGEVQPKSLGARAGLQTADRLISAWGASLAFLPAEKVAQALLGPAGSELKLTIQRQVVLPKAQRRGFEGWGMRLEMERLGLAVHSVALASVAAQRGILALDRVVAIDGQPTRYLPLEEARRLLENAGERGTTLEIQRDLMIRRE